MEAGRTRRAEMQWRTPGAAGVAARRGGTRGERPVSPPVRGTGQRHRAGSAMSACPELELRARVSRSQPAWAETPSPARRRLGAVERGHAVRRGTAMNSSVVAQSLRCGTSIAQLGCLRLAADLTLLRCPARCRLCWQGARATPAGSCHARHSRPHPSLERRSRSHRA